MTDPMLIVFGILACAIALFAWGRPRADIVAILVVLALMLSRVLTPQESLAGFGDPVVILISGCQDNQTSMDGEHNGAFTEQLLKVWNQGAFQGNYANFHARIRARMPATQTPNLFTLGAAGPFLAQEPVSMPVQSPAAAAQFCANVHGEFDVLVMVVLPPVVVMMAVSPGWVSWMH